MIARQQLLADLQKLLQRLETDLLERSASADVPKVGEALHADYEQAKAAARTAQNYEDWRSDAITQVAAAWVLSCVFVRFLEDNRLIEPPKIAGPGERLRQARDEWELYLAQTSEPNERDYLLGVFDILANLPGTKDVFGVHNPIRELPNWLSGDAAALLLQFFQKINADTGLLVHDFTDPDWDTRFLGDLYQDLSEAARKKYALLQTPEFVEEFILDRTLDPALDEFGLDAPQVKDRLDNVIAPAGFRMIDPACGSGHFLLGSFRRILDRWQKREPAAKTRDLVQRTLDCIYGVDVNPYAVAIARFRLLLVAMRACGIARLADAPAFHLNLACGDSLLHGPGSAVQTTLGDIAEVHHAYQPEDLPLLRKYLTPGLYYTVVANPPYIVPKDQALNEAYRKRYQSCHRQYSLAVPFMERIFQLAVEPCAPRVSGTEAAGYTGQITANSFMKREFGKKLIEEFLPQIDLTHVIDTSGAYIPGHGTPTVILFGRNRKAVTSTIRTVMGIRGEPSTPDDPAQGVVWSSIVAQIDQPDSQSEFVSVNDSLRDNFHKHPWSIGGGGAAELKETIEEQSELRLEQVVSEIGATVVTREDEAFQVGGATARRRGISLAQIRPMIDGEHVRDWSFGGFESGIWPYVPDTLESVITKSQLRFLWPFRTGLASRVAYGKTQLEHGKEWYEYSMFFKERLRGPYRIAQAEVATHNHFVLERGCKVFKQTAPVIKLPAKATEDDHLALLGVLNSSTACFWLKQVCFPKGGDHVGQEGARVRRSLWDERFAFNATNLQQLPLPNGRPLELTRYLDNLAQQLTANKPRAVIARWQAQAGPPREDSLREALDRAYAVSVLIRGEMILMQEDLDWQCYRLYGLIDDDIVMGIQSQDDRRTIFPGMRAFEVVLAQNLAAGKTQTTWFERHGITPSTELPGKDFNPKYHQIAERRMEVIRTNPLIALIEQPEYKRRWYEDIWGTQREDSLREWLLDRLDRYFDFDGRMSDAAEKSTRLDLALTSVAKLTDIARLDGEFQQVGELYRGDQAFDVQRLVAELVEAESVPLLPALRYKPSGLRKRAEWEMTWKLQRREDAGDLVGQIPVPPKYTSADFLKSDFWRLRGKLDVPKERWVSFPNCEGADDTLVIAWAGYDHLQLAGAISAYYVDVQERLGGRADPRLVPLLGCLVELLPWIKQWHNEPDVAFNGMRMGDYFDGFITEEARQLGKTIEAINAWTPPPRAGRRRRGVTT